MSAARLQLRRRLLLLSAPVAVVLLLAAAKMISVVVAGDSAETHFARGDADALGTNVATLNIFNVIEPAKAPFAAGTLAVLDDRLADADARFTEALQRTDADRSCPVRVNLELVRERQGDHAAWDARPDEARERYTSALNVIAQAPADCFAGNSDPDPERRAVRDDAEERLTAKLAGLDIAPPPPPPVPPPPPPAAAPLPPALAALEPDPEDEPDPLQLNPDDGDPIERLQQILEDAAG